MGRLVGIVVASVAALALVACGSSTTTVVNNTTTVTATARSTPTVDDGPAATSTVTTTAQTFAQCGDGPPGSGIYAVQSTQVDCDEALAVAGAWYRKCPTKPSINCSALGFPCALAATGARAGDVNCIDGSQEIRFSFSIN